MLTARTYEEMLEQDIDAFMQKVKHVCAKKLRNIDLAGIEEDDVTQEVLMKVYMSLDNYDASKARLSTYVHRVIDNMIADCLRRCGAKKNLMVVNSLSIIERPYGEEEKGEFVHLGITDEDIEYFELFTDIMENLQLNEIEKQVFRLRASGYEFAEIANYLKIKKHKVYSIWNHIKRKVETLL